MLHTMFSTWTLKPIFLSMKEKVAVYLCLLRDLSLRLLWLFTAQTLAFSLQKSLLCLKKKTRKKLTTTKPYQ